MKRDNQNSRENPVYSGRMNPDAYLEARAQDLQDSALDAQINDIRLVRAGNAVRSIAEATYELGVKAPLRLVGNLASLAGSVGVGLAGVVANTAVGVGGAILQGYAALASREGNGEAYSAGANDAFRAVFEGNAREGFAPGGTSDWPYGPTVSV